MLELGAILITLTALLSYLNHRFLKLPTQIGVMLIALLLSLSLIVLHHIGLGIFDVAQKTVSRIQFDEVLLDGMLSFLLFAGALHVDLLDLRSRKWIIVVLATFGVLASTFIFGAFAYYIVNSLFGLPIDFIYCLLLGAILAPTDPIAVLGILTKTNAPKSLEIKVVGESLFNDGVGVVVFLLIVGVINGTHPVELDSAIWLFIQETVGGALFGIVAGLFTNYLLKNIDDYSVEVLLTVALVSGGFTLAKTLGISGPIAMVAAGLVVGGIGREHAMSERTRERLDNFWEIVDEILNAILFVLIGLEILVIQALPAYILPALICIPFVVVTRFLCVSAPITLSRKLGYKYSPHSIKILTWAGLRGGISVALALSVTPGIERNLILTITYAVVIFSITVQGLTIGKLIRYAQTGQKQT